MKNVVHFIKAYLQTSGDSFHQQKTNILHQINVFLDQMKLLNCLLLWGVSAIHIPVT